MTPFFQRGKKSLPTFTFYSLNESIKGWIKNIHAHAASNCVDIKFVRNCEQVYVYSMY